VDQGLLARLFEPEVEARQGTCPLEMSACSALARRLDGRIDARARPGGGVAILVKMATLAS
jgi:hypothetical protein